MTIPNTRETREAAAKLLEAALPTLVVDQTPVILPHTVGLVGLLLTPAQVHALIHIFETGTWAGDDEEVWE